MIADRLAALREAANRANPGREDLDLKVYFIADDWRAAEAEYMAAALDAAPALEALVRAAEAEVQFGNPGPALRAALDELTKETP